MRVCNKVEYALRSTDSVMGKRGKEGGREGGEGEMEGEEIHVKSYW